jgi:hypothetical protein
LKRASVEVRSGMLRNMTVSAELGFIRGTFDYDINMRNKKVRAARKSARDARTVEGTRRLLPSQRHDFV